MGALLTSRLSDDFEIGPRSLPIPLGIADKIIRHGTSWSEPRLEEAVNFFRDYPVVHTNPVAPTKMAQFWLEDFFQKAERTGMVDSARFFVGDPENPYTTPEYLFTFPNNGRTIRASVLKLGKIIEIDGLVEIKKGHKRQVILCETMTTKRKLKYARFQVDIVRALTGERTRSPYLVVFPRDAF